MGLLLRVAVVTVIECGDVDELEAQVCRTLKSHRLSMVVCFYMKRGFSVQN